MPLLSDGELEAILDDLIMARSKELNVQLPETEVDAAFNEGKKNLPEDAFNKELAARNLTGRSRLLAWLYYITRSLFNVLRSIEALLYVAILTVGPLSGRIRLRQRCCAPSDPAKDLRMRAAFEDDAPRRP